MPQGCEERYWIRGTDLIGVSRQPFVAKLGCVDPSVITVLSCPDVSECFHDWLECEYLYEALQEPSALIV